MEEHRSLEYIFPCKDVVRVWKFASIISGTKGRIPQTKGFQFQFAIRDFMTHQLKYIPYLTSKMIGISGITHQYDSIFLRRLVIKGRKDLLLMECKWHARSVSSDRKDIMIFNQKAFDVYHKLRNEGRNVDLYRIFVSSVPLKTDAVKFCLSYGILPIQPFEESEKLPVEILVDTLKKVMIENPGERTKERKNLIDSLYRFRERIFWGCRSNNNMAMESGVVLFDKYRELTARARCEVS